MTMSFPVFWEYSFKAVLKIAWNGKDDDEPRWRFEDMVGRKTITGRRSILRSMSECHTPAACANRLCASMIHCPKYQPQAVPVYDTAIVLKAASVYEMEHR